MNSVHRVWEFNMCLEIQADVLLLFGMVYSMMKNIHWPVQASCECPLKSHGTDTHVQVPHTALLRQCLSQKGGVVKLKNGADHSYERVT